MTFATDAIGPALTKLSTYKTNPKWTMVSGDSKKLGKGKNSKENIAPGPAAYDPTTCIDKTSKFRKISSPCSFSTCSRFSKNETKLALSHAVPGPGTYSPPSDYSSSPHRSLTNITFGNGERLFPRYFHRQGIGKPGPAEYDIRGKHRGTGLAG